MKTIGRALTGVGVLAILLPLLAGLFRIVGGPDVGVALEYAPSFVIGGLLLFVVGTALRVYG